MEIYCKSITVNKDETNKIPVGDYLVMETSTLESNKTFINLNEFESLYLKGKRSVGVVSVLPSSPQIGLGIDILQSPQTENKKYDYSELMNFLVEKINISNHFGDGDEENLTIQSDLGMILELPWEDIVSKNICVYRMVIGQDEKEFNEGSENNLLLFMSHAHEGIGANIKEVMDKEIKAIYDSTQYIIGENNQHFRMESIFLLKHTTKKSFESVPWEKFNFAHFIMHGDQNGHLHLEKQDPQRYKESDFIKINDVLEIVKEHNFKLVFLSVCFSGGGLLNGDSLAFQLVKQGFSKYAIGYAEPAGENSAKDFSDFFYKNLMNGGKIEDTYKESLKSYYKSRTRIYTPLLYIHSKI